MSSNPVPFQWQEVDSTLANPMLLDLSLEIRDLIHEDEQQIRFLNIGNQNSATEPSQRLQIHVLRSDEWAARTYGLYCEAWQCQRKDLSPQFLRAVCENAIRTLISARVAAVSDEFAREQHRTNSHNVEWLKAVTGSFRHNMELLFGKWQRAVEIDAQSLEYMLGGASGLPAAQKAAKELVHARTQVRYLEARIASTKTRLTAAERALSATQLRPADPYRIKTIEQIVERLKADRAEFRSRHEEWRARLSGALGGSPRVTRPSNEGEAEPADQVWGSATGAIGSGKRDDQEIASGQLPTASLGPGMPSEGTQQRKSTASPQGNAGNQTSEENHILEVSEQRSVITAKTFFVLDADALTHAQDRPGELIAAYKTIHPSMSDMTLLCFSESSARLLQKLRSMQADRQKLLIHWSESEEDLKQVPDMLRAYLDLKATGRALQGKNIDDALQSLRSFFETDKKKRGRPRQDAVRDRVEELRRNGHSWGEIQRILNKETGVERTANAYRNLKPARPKPDKS